MNARQPGPETPSNDQEDRYLASTHEVFNQPPALENYNPVSYTHLTLPTICSV